MKYGPIVKQVNRFNAKSVISHWFFFRAMDILLPRSWHFRQELKKWAAEKPGHRHVLDAGSGMGQYVYLISRQYPDWSVLGVDQNPAYTTHNNMIFRKMSKQNVLFRTADLTEFECKERFDLGLAIDLAEYVKDDNSLFKNLYGHLREDGMLLLYVHLIDEKNPRKKRRRMKLVEEQERNGYTRKGLKAQLMAAGFKRIKIRYAFGVAGNISWIMSVFIPLKMVNLWIGLIVLLPVYYLLLLPFIIILNYMESHTGHIFGTAMLVKARK